MSVPRWIRPTLAAIGVVIAGYLTLLHFDSSVPLYCSNTGVIDCAQVLTSAQSVVLGLPVALYGLVWFIVALWLLWGAGAVGGWKERAANIWTLIGAAVVVYLVYTELLVIGKICIWCTSVHIIVLAIFVLQTLAPPRPEPDAGAAPD